MDNPEGIPKMMVDDPAVLFFRVHRRTRIS